MLLLLVLCGACNRTDTLTYETAFSPSGRISIAYLRSLCTDRRVAITTPLIIEGRITANDHYGEWNRSLVVADPSGGIEVLLDAPGLYRRYAVGTPVRIFCEGLCLGEYGGMIRLGTADAAGEGAAALPEEAFDRHIRRLADEDAEPVLPREMTLAACTPDLAGSFVRLHGVSFVPEEQGLKWCDTHPETALPTATTRHLCDEAGNRLAVYTLGSCLYGSETLPEGSGTVCGILNRFNGRLELRVTNRDFFFTK